MTPPWHTQSPDAACAALETDPAHGLSTAEAGSRLARHGENRLLEAKPRPAWLKFLDQFRNFLVIVLLFAAALAWAIGDLKDAVVILVVVVFNAALGFYQEHRAEQTLAALKNMLAAQARVRRDGRVMDLDASATGARRHRAAGGGRPHSRRRAAAGGARAGSRRGGTDRRIARRGQDRPPRWMQPTCRWATA